MYNDGLRAPAPAQHAHACVLVAEQRAAAANGFDAAAAAKDTFSAAAAGQGG